MDLLGVLAGWEPDDGSYDWECRDAILKWTFYTSVPISILRPIRKLDTADQIFKYLAKRFRDSEPIPHANKFQRAGTAAAAEMPEKSPTSADAATERHASAERNNEDLTTTKALTRGTEDVDNRNVRHQDPHMKAEASAQGTSAKCTETTPVVLKSALPHETQTKLQNSLPLTPRPPIEGEPSRCKQEAAESVVMAGRANRTVETAEPTEIADVDGMALLGREPAERARGIGEGDEMERKAQSRLQETKLLCGEIDQRSGNANETVPIANGLPLEGEWIVCASGEIGCERSMDGRACVDKAEEADQVPAECCQQLGMADGDSSRDIEPPNVPNESEELVPVLIESESLGSGGIPCVHLGGTRCRVGNANRPGNGADASYCETDVLKGQADVSRARTDASNVSDRAKTDVTGHGENASTYLSAGDARCSGDETDGVGSHTDVPSRHGDVLSVEMNAILPTNAPENVSIPRKRTKPPDLPVEVAICAPAESDGLGN